MSGYQQDPSVEGMWQLPLECARAFGADAQRVNFVIARKALV
jgi:hypothetical protein